MKDLVKTEGREGEFEIWSGSISSEEEGNSLYPPARAKLSQHGIPVTPHRAH